MSVSDVDYIAGYEAAMDILKIQPNDRSAQYRAVLNLARAGSLEAALKHFETYGLSVVEDTEDIMALGARLEKDLFLRSEGPKALAHAKRSAQLYKACYQKTGGYFSGINSATMLLMSGGEQSQVSQQAQAVLATLDRPNSGAAQDRYFAQASRAEAYALQKNIAAARESLKTAMGYDPLNYSAHATTLKQFYMILSKHGEAPGWLSDFTPPKAAHFAGHIFSHAASVTHPISNLSSAQIEALTLKISDSLQRHDIGFGYGALAAGSDILIAEQLLAEGAELHVVLPVCVDEFVKQSVKPFGAIWHKKFKACLAKATSVTQLPYTGSWPDGLQNRFAAQVAMGKAALRGQLLSVPCTQILLRAQNARGSHTATHEKDWLDSNHSQIIIPFPDYVPAADKGPDVSLAEYQIVVSGTDLNYYDTPQELADGLRGKMLSGMTCGYGAHIGQDVAQTDHDCLEALRQSAKPGDIFISETLAAILQLRAPKLFHLTYAGQLDVTGGGTQRAYTLNLAA